MSDKYSEIGFEIKFKLLLHLKELNNNLNKCKSIVNSVKRSDNKNNCNNNCVKMCRISTECKALDIYEDKCEYNKHFN